MRTGGATMIQKKIVLAGMLIMFGFCGSMDSVASASNLSKAEVVVEKNEVRNIGKNIQADGNGVLVKSVSLAFSRFS